jgi:cytochrome c peroxidase
VSNTGPSQLRFGGRRTVTRTLGARLTLLVAVTACGEPDQRTSEATDGYRWELPAGFPEPFVPDDNPMSEAKVELGRHLFYDQRLSVNGTQACASCHVQARAFTDGRATPRGATGHELARNAMSLTNVAYSYPYTWANPLLETLEEQALVPMFADFPVELGLSGVMDDVLAAFQADDVYAVLFRRAFPEDTAPFRSDRIVAAIAAFERSLISGGSPYDRYAYGDDPGALSTEAQRGLDLFNSERFECYHCHTGLNFTTAFRADETPLPGSEYQNDGLYDVDGFGGYPPENPGLIAMTGNPLHAGRFRVPTLRNVEVTAPYMHDGSIATLEEVLDHYAAGGRLTTDGPNAGDGRKSPTKSPFVRGFSFEPGEKEALLALLRSLTDEAFLTDPKFSDPWTATTPSAD